MLFKLNRFTKIKNFNFNNNIITGNQYSSHTSLHLDLKFNNRIIEYINKSHMNILLFSTIIINFIFIMTNSK